MKSCPACGAGLQRHTPEDADNWEAWGFYCYAEVMRMDGKLVAEEPCHNALRFALRDNPDPRA
jgi:hypothetical protein